MGEVIGYKGSAKQRAAAWTTMLKLRRDIALLGKLNPSAHGEFIKMEQEWLSKEFRSYVA